MPNEQNSNLVKAAKNLLLLYPSKADALMDIIRIQHRLGETEAPESLHLLAYQFAELIYQLE